MFYIINIFNIISHLGYCNTIFIWGSIDYYEKNFHNNQVAGISVSRNLIQNFSATEGNDPQHNPIIRVRLCYGVYISSSLYLSVQVHTSFMYSANKKQQQPMIINLNQYDGCLIKVDLTFHAFLYDYYQE